MAYQRVVPLCARAHGYSHRRNLAGLPHFPLGAAVLVGVISTMLGLWFKGAMWRSTFARFRRPLARGRRLNENSPAVGLPALHVAPLFANHPAAPARSSRPRWGPAGVPPGPAPPPHGGFVPFLPCPLAFSQTIVGAKGLEPVVFWFIGFWRGLPAHRTTIDPSTRQFGLPA